MSRRWPSVTAHFLRSRRIHWWKNLSYNVIFLALKLKFQPLAPNARLVLPISNGEVQKLAWHETKNNLVPNVSE